MTISRHHSSRLRKARARYTISQESRVMLAFSYLSGLTSVVLALGIARLLTSLGRMFQMRGKVSLYWVHLVWAVNLFLYIVLIWWILYRWEAWTDWSYFLFLFLLASPIVTFLQAVLLFPDPMEEGTNFKRHFLNNRRAFFVLGAMLPLLDVMDTGLKGWNHLAAQGWIYPLTIALTFVLNLVAARTEREVFHKFYAVFLLVYLMAFITINLRVLT